MSYNIAPINTPNSLVNMLRPPYSKELPASLMRLPLNDFQRKLDFLFDTFLENYNRFKAGKMPFSLEKEYRLAGIPGPRQYEAFSMLFDYFKNEEFELLKDKMFFFYSLNSIDTEPKRSIIEFIENMINFDFDLQDKKVIFCCGTFWRRHPEMRRKILQLLERLYTEKKIEIQIYTNCKEEELNEYKKFIEQIKETSRFGLEDRIPIHFIQAGNDYYLIEFPHGEEIVVRLNMFMDIKKIVYKDGFEKASVEQFFYKLIQQALG